MTIRTYITWGEEKITLEKLKIGKNIKLSYYGNELGQALVKRITVVQREPTTNSVAAFGAPR